MYRSTTKLKKNRSFILFLREHGFCLISRAQSKPQWNNWFQEVHIECDMFFSVNAPVVLIRFPARVCFRILPVVPPRISSEIPSEIAPRIRSKIYLAFPTEIPTRASFSDYSRIFFSWIPPAAFEDFSRNFLDFFGSFFWNSGVRSLN